ncbi:MAG: hypothetical protein H6Q76_468 [Firmicutes bacterium]|nr:hypothetical protein [Bacillota bacterium]
MLYLLALIENISVFLLLQVYFEYGNECRHRISLVTMYLFEQCGGLEKQFAKLVAQFHLFFELFPAFLPHNTSEQRPRCL